MASISPGETLRARVERALAMVQATCNPRGKSAREKAVPYVHELYESREVLAAYLAEARRALRPGGTLLVHIQLASSQPRLRSRVKSAVNLWRSRRLLRRGETHTYVRMKLYRFEEVFWLLSDAGFTDVELRMFPTRSDGFHHSCWLARA